jgi:hypothetical protein
MLKERRIQGTGAGAGTCLRRDGFDLGSAIGDVGRVVREFGSEAQLRGRGLEWMTMGVQAV